MKIEEFNDYFNEETKLYEFKKETLEEIINNTNSISKGKDFTENGIKIIKIMQENDEKYLGIFSAKQLGELLFISPRSISGSMRKLINDNYIEKIKGSGGTTYLLTEKGKNLQFDNE